MSPSPFFQPQPTARADSLAILHLKRDLLLPTILRSHDELNEGYSEGKVTNTRFGSFPHSTLIDVPWGSQVRASAVDTGTRGRKGWERGGKKRKRSCGEGERAGQEADGVEKARQQKAAVEAKSGFIHLLPPTPEIWTASLPHRTQVVYTPDYSYILHRLKARPGTVLIEAGAGSGSFTHAAARAVFNGYPMSTSEEASAQELRTPKRRGKVWSFEFHEQRAEKLKEEIREHGIDGVVELTYRDVCSEGFVPDSTDPADVKANAIFLDLPAPWLALKHLTRSTGSLNPSPQPTLPNSKITNDTPQPTTTTIPSPLDPTSPIHISTFSPCIEQVQRTISTLRSLGWLDISMVEIAAKRLEVRRERVGLAEEGLRGVNDSPADVDEAVGRLREVEGRSRIFHEEERREGEEGAKQVSKQQRLEHIRNSLVGRDLFKEGRLVHKAEAEIKTHTSYLVFAVLPREWTEEDERLARERWPAKVEVRERERVPVSNRQRKNEAKMKAGGNKSVELEVAGDDDGKVDQI